MDTQKTVFWKKKTHFLTCYLTHVAHHYRIHTVHFAPAPPHHTLARHAPYTQTPRNEFFVPSVRLGDQRTIVPKKKSLTERTSLPAPPPS